MSKAPKTAFFCKNCGTQSPKWLGRCPACAEWNTFEEEVLVQPAETKAWVSIEPGSTTKSRKPRLLAEVEPQIQSRFQTLDKELNRVLGGGIVPGSLVLLGGEPGIGKSTLLLQIALTLKGLRILYVSGEESEEQIKMRAERMVSSDVDCYLFAETDTDAIFRQAKALEPDVLIIDSIQTMESPPLESAAGSVSQVRESTARFLRFAKETGTPVFMIGHITKDGSLAGPKVLEHMVDTVLQFEGDQHHSYRLLRTTKNRFGSTQELGIYEMQSQGLRQVSNPSELLISQREEDLAGIAIACTLEGNRPLLVEIQALVSPASYGTPQRNATGFDNRRLQMLLAVLEKRCGFRLGQQDVFLNVAGGLRLEDPAVDLAVCAAVVSSLTDYALSEKMVFAAEVGLGGELRAVQKLEQRVAEAKKLGYKQLFAAQSATKQLAPLPGIQISGLAKLSTLFDSWDL